MLTQQPVAAHLLGRFRTVRQATMDFAARLTPEDMMVQSCPEASPVKWHLAHTSWFFETFILSEFLAAYQPFNPDFRWLFNSYYKALGEMPEKKLRASFSRPPLAEILAYRAHVDAAIEHLLDHTPEDEALRRIVLGLEHEYQHLELAATDIKHAFFTNPLHPAYAPANIGDPSTNGRPGSIALADPGFTMAPPLNWIPYTPATNNQQGNAEIGLTPDPSAIESFAFDNENPRHKVFLQPFSLASRLVTCAEYLAFIDENGYTRPELWLSEGWDTLQAEAWQAPLYWRRDEAAKSGWSVFTLHGFQDLADLSETPVCHLSFFEADAFARWSGARLPTEFEWEYAAAQALAETRRNGSSVASGNFLESQRLHPTTATENGQQRTDNGEPASTAPQTPRAPHQLFGDVWEWTASPYTGYPGYKPLPGALGEYNGKFMSSQIILRGGSCVTPQAHIRATYRNFFHPATRWQFSGLRLAKDVSN
jgi:ergothioneine biosynthesis protein EgtB